MENMMNEAQEQIKEENSQEENIVVDIDETSEKKEDVVEAQQDNLERTDVRSEDQEEELETYSDNVQKRINQLTAKRKLALEEADAAFKYAEDQKKKNDELQKKLEQLNTGYTSEFGSRIESQTAQAKKLYKEAFDAGDADKMSEATDLMAKLSIENERLRIQKLRTEQSKAAPTNEGQDQANEAQARQATQKQDLDPKLQSWLDKNTWFAKDMVMTRGAQALHEIVISEGFDPSSDEYYKEIDKRMRKEFPQKFQVDRKNAQTVAPASNGKAINSGRKKQIELTPGQVAFAKKMRIPLEQYAKEVAKIETRKGA
jgi:DNA repair exonuclease SbcCD ATPase subunit